MRSWKVGTLTCGLLLISLGILLIVYQADKQFALNLIFTWWPAILIFLGLEVLVSNFIASRQEYKIHYDGISIFLIIIIIFFSIGAFGAKQLVGNHIFFNSSHFNFNNYKYESKFHKSISVSPKEKFVLDNSMGDIQIEKSNGNNIEIEADITIRSNNEDYAKEISESAINVYEGNDVKITSKIPENDSNAALGSINYTIKIPQKMNLEINNKFGKVETKDLLGALKVTDKNGNVSVINNSGDLVVDSSFGNIDIQQINGTVNASNKNGSIKINKVQGNTKVDNSFGSITVNDVTGNLDANNSNGKMDFKDISGYVTGTNKFGNIDLVNAGDAVRLSSDNGSISFENKNVMDKNLKLESKFGGITVRLPRSQQGQFNANTKFGSISNDFDLNVKEVNHSEKSINQKVGASSPDLYLRTENGKIQLIAK